MIAWIRSIVEWLSIEGIMAGTEVCCSPLETWEGVGRLVGPVTRGLLWLKYGEGMRKKIQRIGSRIRRILVGRVLSIIAISIVARVTRRNILVGSCLVWY
jgi:hypothetical protein